MTGQVHVKKNCGLAFSKNSFLQNAKNNNLCLKIDLCRIKKKLASSVHGNFIYLYF